MNSNPIGPPPFGYKSSFPAFEHCVDWAQLTAAKETAGKFEERKYKYKHLLDDPNFKRWFLNVCRGSVVTGETELGLSQFLDQATWSGNKFPIDQYSQEAESVSGSPTSCRLTE